MLLIDANIFLEVQLQQQREEECAHFLQRVQQGMIEAAVTDLTVDSIVFVLERRGKSTKDIRTFLASLFLYKGLSIITVGMEDKVWATIRMEESGLDFEDSAILQTMLTHGISTLISFDRDFDKVKAIKRIPPSNA